MTTDKEIPFPSKQTFVVAFEIAMPQNISLHDSDVHVSIEGTFCQATVEAHSITEARTKIEKCFEEIQWLD